MIHVVLHLAFITMFLKCIHVDTHTIKMASSFLFNCCIVLQCMKCFIPYFMCPICSYREGHLGCFSCSLSFSLSFSLPPMLQTIMSLRVCIHAHVSLLNWPRSWVNLTMTGRPRAGVAFLESSSSSGVILRPGAKPFHFSECFLACKMCDSP
jgi:hypothetical protein